MIYCIYLQRFLSQRQRLKHREYSKNKMKIPPPKFEKGGENRKKSKKIYKSGGHHARGLGRLVLFPASRFMEMGDRGHRNALRHGLCRCYGSPIQQTSCMVRPPAPLSSRLPKICLRTGTIHKKTDVTSRLFKFNG